MKHGAKLVAAFILGLTGTIHAQTNTVSSGTWNDPSIWSAGVPTGTSIANVINVVEINTDISIGSGGVFSISQNATDFPGGTEHSLFVDGGGTLDVQGGTTYFGGALPSMTANGASIRVRNGATLILAGPTSFANGTTVLIDAGGTLIINGTFTNNITGPGSFTIQGTVYIDGNYNSNGDVDVLGSGNLFVTGQIITTGTAGTVFGSPNNCTTPPCSGQNLCLGTNVNRIASNQYLCSGSTAVGLTGDAVASATSYRWQSSTTSSTTGFTDIAGAAAGMQNYDPGTPTQTTWYKRRVVAGACTGTSAAVVITIIPGASWSGSTDTDWNLGANWCGGVVPSSTTDVVIPAGVPNLPVVIDDGTPTVIVALCRNLTINSGATLTVNSPEQITVSGNIVNNGTLTVSGTIEFDGTTSQSIGGTGFALFSSVIVNNTSASPPCLTIPGSGLSISTQLTLTSGAVNLSNANLTLGSSVASAGVLAYSGGRLYNGNLTRWIGTGALALGDAPGQFPIGTSADYRPMFFGNPDVTTGGTIRVNHTDVSGSVSVAFSDGGTPVEVRSNSFWSVATGNGLSTTNDFSIRTEGTGMGTVGDVNDLRLTQFNDVTGTAGVNGGTTTNPQVNRTGIPTVSVSSNFYWGSINSTNTPLPIELINFKAVLKSDIVELRWATASERNNDFFTIERAIDIEHFEAIGETVDGQGTTLERTDYFTIDTDPIPGRSYYRLKQTDFDGTFTYSDVRVIDFDGPKFPTLNLYPNPSDGSSITIKLSGLEGRASVPIKIFAMQGQEIHSEIVETSGSGIVIFKFDFTTQLSRGIYIVRAGETLQLTRKLVVD